MSDFDKNTRELRELIASMEADHRARMEPYYRQLVRYESMRPQPRVVLLDQLPASMLPPELRQ